MPTEAQTLMAVTRNVAAAAIEGSRFIVLSSDPVMAKTALVGTYKADGRTRDEVFGGITSQERVEVLADGNVPLWTGVFIAEDRYILFEGEQLSFHEIDIKSGKPILHRSLPWDLPLPPRDRGGEATRWEVSELRDKFKKAFHSSSRVKVSGVARIPAKWVEAKGLALAMALRVKDFPLGIAECNADEPTQCQLTRLCPVPGLGISPDSVTGIVAREEERMLVFGDRKKHRMRGFKFNSCHSVTHSRDWLLPAKIKELSHLNLTADGSLIVTTQTPDDYLNANLFLWKKEEW
ncbi:hypothetical protein E3A20_25130 [Planctomyces bekefii]|uniref:Phytase-like domain-containing protein n=1 Tax=Planctomyces bekefii TaxID=1653850 RepID=A0A5C6M2D7_9PLAN|nr:hypothetical protein E3A20_25130 [Planctomyces bekefii]